MGEPLISGDKALNPNLPRGTHFPPPGQPTHPLGTRCHPQPTPPSSPSSGPIHPSSGAHGQLPLTPVCPSIWALTIPTEASVVPGAGPAVIHRGVNMQEGTVLDAALTCRIKEGGGTEGGTRLPRAKRSKKSQKKNHSLGDSGAVGHTGWAWGLVSPTKWQRRFSPQTGGGIGVTARGQARRPQGGLGG